MGQERSEKTSQKGCNKQACADSEQCFEAEYDHGLKLESETPESTGHMVSIILNRNLAEQLRCFQRSANICFPESEPPLINSLTKSAGHRDESRDGLLFPPER